MSHDAYETDSGQLEQIRAFFIAVVHLRTQASSEMI